jgi:hypothetical protein
MADDIKVDVRTSTSSANYRTVRVTSDHRTIAVTSYNGALPYVTQESLMLSMTDIKNWPAIRALVDRAFAEWEIAFAGKP